MKMSNVVYNETTYYYTVTVFFNNLKNSYVTATIADSNLKIISTCLQVQSITS